MVEFTYEFYFSRAMHYNEKQEYEAAVASLFFAAGCVRNSQVTDLLIQYTESIEYDAYKLELSFRKLVLEAVGEELYEPLYQMLYYVFYEMETKNSMVLELVSTLKQRDVLDLYKLIEITLGEQSNGRNTENCLIHDFLEEDGQLNLVKLQSVFLEIQLLTMRVWFQLEGSLQRELVDYCEQKNLSATALAVMMKYSVVYEDCQHVFCTVAELFFEAGIKDMANALTMYASVFPQSDILWFQSEAELPELREIAVRYISAVDRVQSTEKVSNQHSLEAGENEAAVIICSNHLRYQSECILYLQRQFLPKNFRLEVLIVTDAESMCQGYNAAMRQSRARYKIFMHHDTFLVNQKSLLQTIDILDRNEAVGLLGVAGNTGEPEDGVWWNVSLKQQVYSLFQYVGLGVNVLRSDSALYSVSGIDGVYMATKRDLAWREDLFTDWHFYDLSQCREYEKAGLKLAVVCDDKPWLWHKLTQTKGYLAEYERNRRIYIETYRK